MKPCLRTDAALIRRRVPIAIPRFDLGGGTMDDAIRATVKHHRGLVNRIDRAGWTRRAPALLQEIWADDTGRLWLSPPDGDGFTGAYAYMLARLRRRTRARVAELQQSGLEPAGGFLEIDTGKAFFPTVVLASAETVVLVTDVTVERWAR